MNWLNKPTPIQDVLPHLLEKTGIQNYKNDQIIRETWTKIAGPNILEVTEIKEYKQGVLKIKVIHPSWRMDLHYRKPEILIKIKQVLPEMDIQAIEFI